MMEIIPAIDIMGGKCVRLSQGDFERKKVYNEHPLEAARQFEDAGLRRLHLVDLDGAKAGRIINHKVLEQIAAGTQLQVDFGGGLQSDQDVRIAFESGAQQVTGGTIAVKNRDVFIGWLENYGPERIILGADVRDGFIAVSGWQEKSRFELFAFLKDYTGLGIRYSICTDISRDGLLQGSATDLYSRITDQFPDLYLIASGGVTTIDELHRLKETGCYGAVIGKAIYEGRINLKELEVFF